MTDAKGSTDRESPFIAGDAFYAAFKREPKSPSDAAWMNGYTAGRRSPGGARVEHPDLPGLAKALRTQKQIDEDGCEVGVSRQACDEAATIIESLRSAPEPGEKARLMEYAVAAGDAIVEGVPQWRDGWAIISRIQTASPNDRWMLHDADEREKESRAEAEQLALVNTGMDFAVVPIKWRTPTKDGKL